MALCDTANRIIQLAPTDEYRPHIGLDVDGILANFGKAMIDFAKVHKLPWAINNWWEQKEWFLRGFDAVWNRVKNDPLFWLAIEPFDEYPQYIPGAYVTARPVPSIVTEAWLALNDYPRSRVITVEHSNEKVALCVEAGITTFVDDKPSTVKEINDSGKLKCYLFDRPWNRTYDYPRISSVNAKELE